MTIDGLLPGGNSLSGAPEQARPAATACLARFFNDNDIATLTRQPVTGWFLATRLGDGGGVLDLVTDKTHRELRSDAEFKVNSGQELVVSNV